MLKILNIHTSVWKLLLLAGDIAVISAAIMAGLFLDSSIFFWPAQILNDNKSTFLVIIASYLFSLHIADLYNYLQDFRRRENLVRCLLASWLGSLMILLLFYFSLNVCIGLTFFLTLSATFSILLVIWRYTFSSLALPQRLSRRLIIVGAGKAGQTLLAALRRRHKSGLIPLGFVDDDPAKQGCTIDGLPVVGNTASLKELIEELQIRVVIVAITNEKSPYLIDVLTNISWNGCQVLDMPDIYEFMSGKIPVEHVSNLWVYVNCKRNNKVYSHHLKRLFDLSLALISMIVIAPFWAVIALAIKLDSRGPVFFRQDRSGQDNKTFSIYKFRTMVENASEIGGRWTEPGDPRITKVGHVLRRYHLDETPQFINILRGEMSFVGPRPEWTEITKDINTSILPVSQFGRYSCGGDINFLYYDKKFKDPYYKYRLLAKPGLTGWAQVTYQASASLDEVREKLKYDLYYIKNMGFFLDLLIILRTIRIVLFGRRS